MTTTTPALEELIRHMVNRFLGWRLPEDFRPDAGISFKADYNENTPYPMKHKPIGTNLFDATQAEAMVRYMLEGAEAIAAQVQPATGPICSYDGCNRRTLCGSGCRDDGTLNAEPPARAKDDDEPVIVEQLEHMIADYTYKRGWTLQPRVNAKVHDFAQAILKLVEGRHGNP